MKLLFKLLVSLCAVLMIVSCDNSSSTPESVAKAYVEAFFNGNADKVISLIYIPDDAKNDPGAKDMMSGKIKQGVMKAKEKASKDGGVKNITVEKAQYSEDKQTAEVPVTVTFKGDAPAYNETIKVIKTDDGWKLKL